jgi:hypothetical protein
MAVQDDRPYQGAAINGYAAAIAPGFPPRMPQYIRHETGSKFLFTATAVLLVAARLLIWVGSYVRDHVAGWVRYSGYAVNGLGFLIGLLGVIVGIFSVWWYRRCVFHFENGLLVPGVVVAQEPLSLVVLAPMDHGDEGACYALRRVNPKSLPYHAHTPGTRVPFVTLFVMAEGEPAGRWAWFDPEPISHGTTRAAEIDQCFHRLGEAPFHDLAECVRRVPLPQDETELVLLDAHRRHVATVKKPESGSGSKSSAGPTVTTSGGP